ncbi:MAG: hypothetical protein ACXAEU_04015 [Candidatus Hodarchaeales archaeon]
MSPQPFFQSDVDHFCSICRNKVVREETFVCTNCHLVVCPECYARKFLAHSDRPRCLCGSTDVLNFGEIKNSLIKDLIGLRNRVKESSYKPVILYLKFLKLMDEINVISHDFYTDVIPDIDKIRENLLATGKFVLYYLEDYSRAIKRLQSVLMGLEESRSYSDISFHMKYFKDQIVVFGQKIEDSLAPFISEQERLEREHSRCIADCNLLNTRLKPIKSYLHFGELPLRIFRKIKIKTGKRKINTFFVFTTERLIIVQWRWSKPWKKVKIIYELTPEDMVDSETINMRFGRKKLVVKSLTGDLVVFTRDESLIESLKQQLWKQISGVYNNISLRSSSDRSYLTAWDVDIFKKRVENFLSLKLGTSGVGRKQNVFLNSLFKKIEAANSIYGKQADDKKAELKNVIVALNELKRNYQSHLVAPKDYYELYSLYSRRAQKLEEEISELKTATDQAWI